ncbi:MAG: hypothetical protein GYA56_13340 [Geobacteraceae bacterium]|nr:hypothetical protein [Geobacteraceae bacterium]
MRVYLFQTLFVKIDTLGDAQASKSPFPSLNAVIVIDKGRRIAYNC